MATVHIRDAFGNFKRVVFDGAEKDARKFLENNFPRLHLADNGSAPEPDAQLTNDNGVAEQFHGPETGWIATPATIPGSSDSGAHSDDADTHVE